MNFDYNGASYNLEIEPLTVSGGHLIYACGEPTFKVLSIIVKDNVSELTLLREQSLEHLDIYADTKCGIYNLKTTSKVVLKLENKYIDEAINKNAEIEIDDLTFNILSEEISDIDYVSDDKIDKHEIEKYMLVDKNYEGIVVSVTKV